jgi:hypothetical protein
MLPGTHSKGGMRTKQPMANAQTVLWFLASNRELTNLFPLFGRWMKREHPKAASDNP